MFLQNIAPPEGAVPKTQDAHTTGTEPLGSACCFTKSTRGAHTTGTEPSGSACCFAKTAY